MKVCTALALVVFVGALAIEGRAIRDVKAALLAHGNELFRKASESIAKLEAENRTHDAAVIKTEGVKIHILVQEIATITEAHQLAKLEEKLLEAELKLDHDLLKVNHVYVHHDEKKEKLLILSVELQIKAQEMITTLKLNGQTGADIAELEKEEALVISLAEQLNAATIDLKQMEKELKGAEERLEKHLHKINKHDGHGHLTKRDLKASLIGKATDLLKKATEAISKLEAAKKTHQAMILKAEETKISKLLSQLQVATEDTKVIHLEHQLGQAEHKLEFELNKLGNL